MQPFSANAAFKAFIFSASFALSGFAFAEATPAQINEALKAGQFAQAETMMQEALAAHPDSAKAHFKYAEILAKNGKKSDANRELSKAESLQPDLAFAKPEAVSALKNYLGKSTSAGSHQPRQSNPLLMWGGLALIGFLAFMVFRAISRRPAVQQPMYNNQPMPNGPQGNPMQGGYNQNPGPQGGGLGGGIMGGLATGAAVGAGIVAGEMLMHNILDDKHPNQTANDNYKPSTEPEPDNSYTPSGNDFVDGESNSWDNNSSFGDSSSFGGDDSGDWS